MFNLRLIDCRTFKEKKTSTVRQLLQNLADALVSDRVPCVSLAEYIVDRLAVQA